MVKLKRRMENRIYVREEKQVGDIYHVCTLEAFAKYIVPEDTLHSSGDYYNFMLNTNQQVCFTRNSLLVVIPKTKKNSGIFFQFKVDGNELSKRHKVIPYNDFSDTDPKIREQEEDVIGPIKNFKSYIKEVYFDIKTLNIKAFPIMDIIDNLEKVKKYLGTIRCTRKYLPFSSETSNLLYSKKKDVKYKINTLDELIDVLKNKYLSSKLNIDTPDLFNNYSYVLTRKDIEEVLKENPSWNKYLPSLLEACKNSRKGKNDLVQFLLDSGADPNMTDNKGNTPLKYAMDKKNKELVDLLIDAGAKEE